jgi:MFS family permease
MPVFAKDILRSGPESLGLLMGATGLGALSGALFLASRKGAAGLERVARLNINVFGVSLVAFSFSRSLVLSMAILVFAGFGMMAQMASNNTILQTVVHDDKRGRVMSIFMMAFMGTVPFGCLLAGALAAQFGAPRTVAALGALCVISSAIFMRDRAVTRKG